MWSNTRANSRSLKTRSGTNIVEELIKNKNKDFGMWDHNFQTLTKDNEILPRNKREPKSHNIIIEYYIFQLLIY